MENLVTPSRWLDVEQTVAESCAGRREPSRQRGVSLGEVGAGVEPVCLVPLGEQLAFLGQVQHSEYSGIYLSGH